MPRPSLLPTLLIFGVGCATASPFAPLDRSTLPKPEAHPDAPGLVLLQEAVVEYRDVEGRAVADETRTLRVVVLRDTGRSLGSLVARYSKSLSAILDARCRITRPDGTIVDRGRDEMKDGLALSDSVLYEDSRVLALENLAEPGSVVECRVVTRYERAGIFSHRQTFGLPGVPIAKARYEVITPSGWELEHLATALWEPRPWAPAVSTTPDGRTHHVWEQSDLPAIQQEPLAPTPWDVVDRVTVRLRRYTVAGREERTVEGFDAYARFLAELTKGTDTPTPEIQRQVAAILTGAPDSPRERARRVYEWIQENIRYVAVEVGMGGWRPHDAREVFEHKYGDCKDKATLMKSMLSVAGIDSHLVEISIHDGLPRRLTQPTLGNANHMILAVDLPDGLVFADPTSRAVPFGELPLGVQEADVVVTTGPRAGPGRTPGTTADDNTSKTTFALTVEASGAAKGKVTTELAGAAASRLRRVTIEGDANARRRTLEAIVGLSNGKLTNAESRDELRDGRLLRVGTADVSFEHALGAGEPRVLRLSELVDPPGMPLPAGARKLPVALDQRTRREWTFTFALPDGLTPSKLPERVELTSKVGRFTLEWRAERSTVIAQALYVLDERILPPEQHELLRGLWSDVAAALARPVVFRRMEGTK